MYLKIKKKPNKQGNQPALPTELEEIVVKVMNKNPNLNEKHYIFNCINEL